MQMKEASQDGLQSVRAYVQGYAHTDDWLAWRELICTLALLVFCQVCILTQYLPRCAMLLNGLLILRLFILFHDMGHLSYFSSLTLNRRCGRLLGIILHFPYDAWRDGHNHHHKHFGNLDRLDLSQTIIFTKQQYEGMAWYKRVGVRVVREPIVFFFLSVHFVWFYLLTVSVMYRYGWRSAAFLDKVLSFVMVLVLLPSVGVPAIHFMISIYIALFGGILLFHVQHSVNEAYRERKGEFDASHAALEGSTYLLLPPLLAYFTFGIEYHHIHHFNTTVPAYAIAQCHNDYEVKRGKWEDLNINTVSLYKAMCSLVNVMYDEDNKRLVPFWYPFL